MRDTRLGLSCGRDTHITYGTTPPDIRDVENKGDKRAYSNAKSLTFRLICALCPSCRHKRENTQLNELCFDRSISSGHACTKKASTLPKCNETFSEHNHLMLQHLMKTLH